MSPSALVGRAFRVEFRAEADISRGICLGRVEHIRSGDAAHFSSVEELLSFVALCFRREGARRTATRRSSA